MTLKLFRSTGYSSILVPGETRVAMHPGWLGMAISLWGGLACNVVLWRALASGSAAATGRALILALLLAAMVVIVNFVVDVLYAVIDPRVKASDI